MHDIVVVTIKPALTKRIEAGENNHGAESARRNARPRRVRNPIGQSSNNDPSRGAETTHHDVIGFFMIEPWFFAVKFHTHLHIHVSNGEDNETLFSRNDAGAHILRRIVHLRQLGAVISQVELMIVRKKAAVENDRQIVFPLPSRTRPEWSG